MKLLIYTSDTGKFDSFSNDYSTEYFKIFFSDKIETATDLFFKENIGLVFFDYDNLPKESLKLLERLQGSNRCFIACFFLYELGKKVIFQLYQRNVNYIFPFTENEDDVINICKILKRHYETDCLAVDFKNIRYENKKISIDNQFDSIQSVIKQLTANLPIVSNSPKKLELALYEVIVNAIEHGNLAITSEEKKKSIQDNTYYELLQQRTKDPGCSNKRSHIESTITPDYAEFIVEDEGGGFDWRKMYKKQESMDILNEHGRGIIMIDNFFDQVEYNERGNRVKLTKYTDFKEN